MLRLIQNIMRLIVFICIIITIVWYIINYNDMKAYKNELLENTYATQEIEQLIMVKYLPLSIIQPIGLGIQLVDGSIYINDAMTHAINIKNKGEGLVHENCKLDIPERYRGIPEQYNYLGNWGLLDMGQQILNINDEDKQSIKEEVNYKSEYFIKTLNSEINKIMVLTAILNIGLFKIVELIIKKILNILGVGKWIERKLKMKFATV